MQIYIQTTKASSAGALLEFPLPQEFPPLEERRGRVQITQIVLFQDFFGAFFCGSLEVEGRAHRGRTQTEKVVNMTST